MKGIDLGELAVRQGKIKMARNSKARTIFIYIIKNGKMNIVGRRAPTLLMICNPLTTKHFPL